MKKTRYILAGILLVSFSWEAQAQTQPQDTTVNRTVVVEQEYNPDIMDASKVNVLPKVEPPVVSKKEVEYDITLMPAGAIPATTMQAYSGKETQAKASPGYVRLGYGNYGNLDVHANYLFTMSARDRLNLALRMDGMDGKLDMPEDGSGWSSYFYRTSAGMDYTHSFDKIDFNAAGHFGLSNFNFLPGSTNSKQKFTSGGVHLGVKSANDNLPLQFRAETNLLFYERRYDLALADTQEGIIRTKADVSGSISDEQSIGVALGMDNVFYSGKWLENYTSLNLNPYYLFRKDDWRVRLGAHVDLAFGFGKQFRAAPDIHAEYIFSDSYALYVQAKGGKLQNDFRRLESITPYGQTYGQADATYEQLNAALGFKASPAPGVWFHIYGGYQNLKNDLLPAISFYEADVPFDSHTLIFHSGNTHNVYAGAEVRYDYKDLLAFSASGVYRNWSINREEIQKALLRFKPSLAADFRIDLKPISPVSVSLGYQHISREKAEGEKAKAVGNLYIGGSYELFRRISVYARINNVLNKEYQYDEGYPAEDINFLGGVSFRF